MGIVILHVLLWVTGTILIGKLLIAWSHQRDIHSHGLMISGAFFGPLALIAPFIGTWFSSSTHKYWLPRQVEFWLIWLGIACLVTFVAWRLNRVLTDAQRVKRLRQEAWKSGDGDDEFDLEIDEIRTRLENRLRAQTHNSHVVLRWSDQIQLPFTIGTLRPEVFAPMWTAYEADGVHVGPLLDHEREHIKLGHSAWSTIIRWIAYPFPQCAWICKAVRSGLEVEADRHLIQEVLISDGDPNRYITALNMVVGPAAASGDEIGLGHDRSNVPLRVDQILRTPRMLWRYPIICFALLVGLIGCHRLIGHVDSRTLWELATLRIQPNYNIDAPLQGLVLHSMPGKGGDFLDGLEVDTRNIPPGKRIQIVLVRSLKPGESPWAGFNGQVFVQVIHRPMSMGPIPLLVGESIDQMAAPQRAPGERVRGSADFIRDLDSSAIDHSGFFQTTVGRDLKGKIRSAKGPDESNNWNLFVPSGWVLQISKVHLAPCLNSVRSTEDLIKRRKAILDALQPDSLANPGTLSWSIERLYNFSHQ
jgi:hypothetical protein